jgi:hypothetical protein
VAADRLDDRAKNEIAAIRIFRLRTRREGKRLVDNERKEVAGGVGVATDLDECGRHEVERRHAGAMMEKLLDRHRRDRRRQIGQIGSDGRIQPDPALVDEPTDRDRGEDLADRREPIAIGGRRGRAVDRSRRLHEPVPAALGGDDSGKRRQAGLGRETGFDIPRKRGGGLRRDRRPGDQRAG